MSFKTFKNIKIRGDHFEEDVKPLIKEIRPMWNLNNLKLKKFDKGISNLLFGVYTEEPFTAATDMVLVRIYGEVLLDRDIEMDNMVALSKHDLAAKVWGKFANGCAYQYIHGSMLELPDIRDDFHTTLITKEFAKLHTTNLNLGRPQEPFIFRKIREIAECLPDHLSDPRKDKIYLENFPNKSTMFQEIECLENHLSKPEYLVTFCHNDLLLHNMILNLNKDRIHFIDFEYADYNYCGFDIGNHFNEFAGLENTDYSLYPDESFQRVWLRKYLEARHELASSKGLVQNGDKVAISETDIDHWYRMVNKFSLASHLLWCVWSIFQDVNSEIDFDYIGYGILRWNEYRKRKDAWLAL